MRQVRYRYGVLPRRDRQAPRPLDWWRAAGVVAAVALVVAVAIGWAPLSRRLACADGPFPDWDRWRAGDVCVGLSEGPYAFGLTRFEGVLRVIERQNRSADKCDPSGTPVTVGVLLTMTDQFAGSRALHELEGMAAGQSRANGTGCLHPVRLLVGHLGQYDDATAAVDVARRLADRPEVVAVAGIGLSHQHTAEVADTLAQARIPMVADLITAEGFDQTGSAADEPGFDNCDRDITYQRGIGRDFYYRVAFRAAAQIAELGRVATARPDFLMVPTGGSDPYTCTALPLMQRQFGGDLAQVKFDSDEPSTVAQTARRLCGVPGDVTVAYIARGRDMARFLHSLDGAFGDGQCAATSVTVLSTSDSNRVRTAEDDPVLEDLRVRGLTSPTFAGGRVRLLATLVSGADGSGVDPPEFAEFERVFAEAGFDVAHIDDGWAVNAYDAMATIATALGRLPAAKPVPRGQVNTVISGFSSARESVPASGGPITFDNSGNRTGPPPPVVRICPPTGTPPRVPSALVRPNEPLPDCPR
ncbi:ABC transporter substrate-binding protein [Saccharothrix obliqua]|uniref:ABC transporter substrate-binding protein n=1 Tax=Saccharothrix obliqua TaxID=2861747 RepID=UPI001C5EE1D0|nr:ABC transporter substrate-binding protein [Saccharothrix obliqua]MBW4716788.1 ABC transporter substrate-binding protein [Saccharothrix obliqua]